MYTAVTLAICQRFFHPPGFFFSWTLDFTELKGKLCDASAQGAQCLNAIHKSPVFYSGTYEFNALTAGSESRELALKDGPGCWPSPLCQQYRRVFYFIIGPSSFSTPLSFKASCFIIHSLIIPCHVVVMRKSDRPG